MRRKELIEGNIYILTDGRHVGLIKKGLFLHLVAHNYNEVEYTTLVPTSAFFAEAGEYYNRMRGVYGDEED